MIRVWGGKHLTDLLLTYAFAALAGPMVYATSQVLLERFYPTPAPAPPRPVRSEQPRPAIVVPIDTDDTRLLIKKPSAPLYDWKGVQYLQPQGHGFATCPSVDPYARAACHSEMMQHPDKQFTTYTFTTGPKNVSVRPANDDPVIWHDLVKGLKVPPKKAAEQP